MLTKEQKAWIAQLSERPIHIVPYDERSERLFAVIKEKVERVLGPRVPVVHGGASSLGISGQDEIDVSIEADATMLDTYIPKLEQEFGPVRKRYPDRARFEVREEGKKIDLKIVDANHASYRDSKRFEAYLRSHPDALEAYRLLKEESNGVATREYYRRKTEFINSLLDKAPHL